MDIFIVYIGFPKDIKIRDGENNIYLDLISWPPCSENV